MDKNDLLKMLDLDGKDSLTDKTADLVITSPDPVPSKARIL